MLGCVSVLDFFNLICQMKRLGEIVAPTGAHNLIIKKSYLPDSALSVPLFQDSRAAFVSSFSKRGYLKTKLLNAYAIASFLTIVMWRCASACVKLVTSGVPVTVAAFHKPKFLNCSKIDDKKQTY